MSGIRILSCILNIWTVEQDLVRSSESIWFPLGVTTETKCHFDVHPNSQHYARQKHLARVCRSGMNQTSSCSDTDTLEQLNLTSLREILRVKFTDGKRVAIFFNVHIPARTYANNSRSHIHLQHAYARFIGSRWPRTVKRFQGRSTYGEDTLVSPTIPSLTFP